MQPLPCVRKRGQGGKEEGGEKERRGKGFGAKSQPMMTTVHSTSILLSSTVCYVLLVLRGEI